MNANKRTPNNVLIDGIGYLSFWILVSTGITMKYVLLPGRERAANDPTSLLGLDRHDWGAVHFWAAMIFTLAIVIHLALHWNWIVGIFQKILSIRSQKIMIPALVLPIVIAFIPLVGFRGFDGSEESGGRNRAGFSTSQNAGLMSTSSARAEESNRSFAAREEGEGNEINGFKIRGRTTLREIEEGTGVRADRIIAALNLPADSAKNERIALLLGQYGVEMSRFREAVKNLSEKK